MESALITEKGKILLAKLAAAKNALNLTRACAGTGRAPDGCNLAVMDELIEYKMDAKITRCEAKGNVAEITVQISSAGIESGFLITEIGIFAEDQDEGEILYAYIDLSKDQQYIYPEGADSIKFVEIILQIVITQDTNVTAYISPDAFALIEDVRTEMDRAKTAEEELKKQIEAEAGRASAKEAELAAHAADESNPHHTTKEQVGLGNADNTADMDKPVSAAQQEALDALYAQLAAYTDKSVADLINGAPSTLDTLGEIAQAMQENGDVVSALNAAIGTKADAAEFDSHVKDKTAHVTAAEKEEWNNKLPYKLITGGDFNKMKTPGIYTMRGSSENVPHASSDYLGLIVLNSDNIDNFVEQIAFEEGSCNVYIRYIAGEGWSEWEKLAVDGQPKIRAGKFATLPETDGGYAELRNDGVHVIQERAYFEGKTCAIAVDSINNNLVGAAIGGGHMDLGSATFSWKNIYASNGTIQISDRAKKKDIKPLDDDIVKKFFMGLIPSSYGMTDGTSGRTHWGMISQDIEKLMNSIGMDSKDFAGFIKLPKAVINKDGNPADEYDYFLRYDEFIAPIIRMVQLHEAEIEELKKENAGLKERMHRMEAALGIITD